jgi:ferredoxin
VTGAELVTLEKFGFKQIDIPDGKKVKMIHAPRYLDEVDAIVNVCKLKTHMQTMMTCALKNWFGLTTQQDRLLAHKNTRYEDFAEALVDIYSALPKPALSIADAVIGMEGTGPSQGLPVKLGFMLASDDAIALDTVAATAIGFQPREIGTIEAARRRGYCATRMREIELLGAPLESVKKKIKRPSSAIFMLMPVLTNPFNELTKVRPYVIRDKCKVCKKCAEVCAGDAITFPGKYALINDKKCVLCFCCHEICPYDAVDIKKPLLVKIAEKVAE